MKCPRCGLMNPETAMTTEKRPRNYSTNGLIQRRKGDNKQGMNEILKRAQRATRLNRRGEQ